MLNYGWSRTPVQTSGPNSCPFSTFVTKRSKLQLKSESLQYRNIWFHILNHRYNIHIFLEDGILAQIRSKDFLELNSNKAKNNIGDLIANAKFKANLSISRY